MVTLLQRKVRLSKTQYIDLCKRILDEGVWVEHKRSGKRRLTVANVSLNYDVGAGEFPLDTTRKSFWKAAVAEMTGYLKGYSNANDFAALGAPTWLANANEDPTWLSNPFRKGDGDMGLSYRFREYTVGVDTGDFQEWPTVDQYKDIISKLERKEDDARLIMSAYAPHFNDYTCLPACLHTHTFTLLGDTLHLHSHQRSCDVMLGGNWNMVQCYYLLAITAQIAGLKAGQVTHSIVNCHIYEDQLELVKEQVLRKPYNYPTFHLDPSIKSLKDLEELENLDNFGVTGYEHHPAIKYPFTV